MVFFIFAFCAQAFASSQAEYLEEVFDVCLLYSWRKLEAESNAFFPRAARPKTAATNSTTALRQSSIQNL
jgi:hypothetical protein